MVILAGLSVGTWAEVDICKIYLQPWFARPWLRSDRVLIMNEPTAALGVRESGQVLRLVKTLRDGGLPVIFISHNMPNVWGLADRIQIMRLGRRTAVVTPQSHTMEEGVAMMTGAREAPL